MLPVKVWKMDADKPIFSQKLKSFGAYCVVFTPDGKSLVTGHDNRSIIITPIGSDLEAGRIANPTCRRLELTPGDDAPESPWPL